MTTAQLTTQTAETNSFFYFVYGAAHIVRVCMIGPLFDTVCLGFLALRYHGTENTTRLLQKSLGRVIFSDVTIIQNKDAVTIHDCVESMSNCEDGRILKVLTNHGLDDSIRAIVYTSSGFVHDLKTNKETKGKRSHARVIFAP